MENNKKVTFDSLNNDINLYSDALEILENIEFIYKSYFNFQQNELVNRTEFIVDCGTCVIDKCRAKGLGIFHGLLISNTIEFNEMINVLDEDILYTIDEAEEIITRRVHLFLGSCHLEAKTFVGKIGTKHNNLNNYMVMASMNNIKTYIYDIMSMTIGRNRKKVTKELKKRIEAFNGIIWIIKKKIKSVSQNRKSLDSNGLRDESLSLRDRFLDELENLKNSIESLIVNEFLIDSVRAISVVIENEIQLHIDKHKKALNTCFIEEMAFSKDNRNCGYSLNNKSVDNIELYGKCREVLYVESENLSLILKLVAEDFNIIMDEIKFDLESVVYNEFYSPIYDVKSEEDFKSMTIAFEAKGSYLVYNLAMKMLESFNKRYNNNIISKIKYRTEIISKLYLFKIIGYRGSFNSYNNTVVIELQRKLYELYNAYDLELNSDKEIEKILVSQEVLKSEIQDLINKYIYEVMWSEVGRNKFAEESIEESKKKFCNNIYKLKSEIWEILNNKFIYNFNYLNERIGRTLEYVNGEIKFYEETSD